MSTTIKAVYKNGVFKPTQQVHFQEREKFCLIAIPVNEWKKEFSKLLDRIHKQTKKHSCYEIENDITLAFNETRKNK